jgi:hypothetical protein
MSNHKKKKKVTSVKSEGFKNKSVVSPQQGEYSYKGKKYRRDVDPGTQLKISGKIAKEQLSNIKKNKTTTPINYGTMNNAINKQFSMTPGSKEVDTQGTFKNDAAVLNMGTPTNYGTPIKKHEPGHEEKPKKKLGTEGMTVEEKIEYYKKQKENTKKQKNSSIKMGIGSNRSSGKNILG